MLTTVTYQCKHLEMDDQATVSKRYHHGDLRNALLGEAERILEAEGMPGLTLRAVARAIGVTHAAPSNHFGDLTGLMSDLAAEGHARMSAELTSAVNAMGDDPVQRARAAGRAYVGFAKAHPGLFTLMFRSERLDAQRPALQEAILKSRQGLRDLLVGRPEHEVLPSATVVAQSIAMWSLVHGYAVLMLEGRLKGMLAALPEPESPEDFFQRVLDAVKLVP